MVEALAGPLAPGQLAQAGGQAASTQPVIGRVDALTGSATVVRNGVSVALNVGDTVRKGDVVQTSGSSSVAIVFTDGTTFSLNANARMVLNDFVFNAGGTGNSASISLVQGAFSFVAGQVAKTGDMRVETPVATMGIRGTAVLVEISANDGQTRFSVMVEPDGTTGSFNLYNKTTGALIATVSNSQVGWVVSPAGPLQVVAVQEQKTPAQLQQELGIVQQIFTIFNNNQQNPFTPTQDRGDNNANDTNPQTAQGGGGSSTPPANSSGNPLVDVINTASNKPSTPTYSATVPLPIDPLPDTNNGPVVTVTVTPNKPPVAVDDPDGSPDGGNVITPTNPEAPGKDADPEGGNISVTTAQHVVRDEGGNYVPSGDPVTIDEDGETIEGTYGTLTLRADGTYTFTPNEAFQALDEDDEATDTFQYTITDPFGETASAILTINLTGENDAPVIITANASGSVSAGAPISSVAAGYLVADRDLIDGLGGDAEFGENLLNRNDDGSTGAIDIRSVFGEQGLNFFGTNYTSFFINNNGNITFLNATGQFTPSQISGGQGNPIIAAYWADVDTRGGDATPTPGGNSTGSNLVYYDLDSENGVVTITWDDVGYFASATDKLNAFQLQLIDRGGGNFDIVFRYEDINWTTGNASGGSGGLGGTPARAGYTAGDGNPAHYFELTGSGNQNSMLALESTVGNTGLNGVYVFEVRAGEVGNPTSTGTIKFSDADTTDTHTVSASLNLDLTGHDTALGTLTVSLTSDTTGGGSGLVTWNYVASPDAVSSLAPGTVRTEVYDVVISDGHGGTVTQQVTITINGPDNEQVNSPPTAEAVIASGNEDASFIPIVLNGSDTDGAVEHFRLLTLPENGQLYTDIQGSPLDQDDLSTLLLAAGNNLTLYFKPDENWNGQTTFQFKAIDDDGSESVNTGTATIDVASVNDAPQTVTPELVEGAENQQARIPIYLQGTDSDGYVSGFKILSLPAGGSLFYLDGSAQENPLYAGSTIGAPSQTGVATIFFRPLPDFSGTVTFEIAAVDNDGIEDQTPATATINIASSNSSDEVVVTICTDSGYNLEEFVPNLLEADVEFISDSHITLYYWGDYEDFADDRIFEVTAENLTYGSQLNEWEGTDYWLTGGKIVAIDVFQPADGPSVHLASLTGYDISATELQAGVDFYDENEGDVSAVEAIFGAYSYDVTGADGPDTLTTGDLDDVIDGGAGCDVIDGQGGNDSLTGGEGADHFMFNVGFGNDIIVDFEPGVDTIETHPELTAVIEQMIPDFEELSEEDFQDLFQSGGAFRIDGSDAVIQIGNDSLRIANVVVGGHLQLSTSDFILNPNYGA
ncbi:MAG: nidogen-like domain-containing protein [Pseudorhodoplanes sp.]